MLLLVSHVALVALALVSTRADAVDDLLAAEIQRRHLLNRRVGRAR